MSLLLWLARWHRPPQDRIQNQITQSGNIVGIEQGLMLYSTRKKQSIRTVQEKNKVSEQRLRHMCIRASLPRVSVNIFFIFLSGLTIGIETCWYRTSAGSP